MFAVALLESLAIVGLVVPGAVVMLAAGALVGLDRLDLVPLLAASVAGAFIGDGASFWLGRRYRDRLEDMWPFRRHPAWLSRGRDFFVRHGGKSVILGRFIGPLRPLVPLAAGMMRMRPASFVAINFASALLWAPAYLLPGVVFGASIALAGAVATRLAVLLVALATAAWVTWWLTRYAFLALSPRAGRLTRGVLTWARGHPLAGRLPRDLLDPSSHEARALLILGSILVCAAWLFVSILEDVVSADPLVRADHGLHELVQSLRTPWGDRIMVFVTQFGDGVVIAGMALVVVAWLLLAGHRRAGAYLGATLVFGQLAALAIKFAVERPRPVPSLYDGISEFAFPSGHATMAMAAYGFMAVMIARGTQPARRWLVFAGAALLIGAIALSRVYLGAHWLSDTLGGLSLGLAWVCLLGIAYYRHPVTAPAHLAPVAVAAILVIGGWHVWHNHGAGLERYAQRSITQHLDAGEWPAGGWQALPGFRIDMGGDYEQPLNLQWAGGLVELERRLEEAGWRRPADAGGRAVLRWLAPRPRLAELPVLPQVHDGAHPALQMTLSWPPGGDGNMQFLVRVWPGDAVLDPGGTEVWLGSVLRQRARHLTWLTLPWDDAGYATSLARLAPALEGARSRLVTRPGAGESTRDWDGSVLLAGAP